MKKIIKAIKDRIQGKVPLLSRRSPHWHTFEKHWLEKHGTCEACDGTKKLQVHHEVPFHKDPSKELDPTNVLTLCEDGKTNCHLHIGHNGNFRNDNPNVRKDAAKNLRAIRAQRKLQASKTSTPGTDSNKSS